MFVKPWSKEAENVLRKLAKKRIAYTSDIQLTRTFGRRYPELIREDFLDIARIHKKDKSVFVLPDDVVVVPKPPFPGGPQSKFMKFHFYKIF